MDSNQTEQLRFLTSAQAQTVASDYGAPVFVYSEQLLRDHAAQVLGFAAPYGLTVRYAMKANPNRHILQLFRSLGIKIDASSGYEAWRALRAGFEPHEILVTTQQFPDDFVALAQKGVQFNACSLAQLSVWGKALPGTEIGVRINPGIGSGHSSKTNVGGLTSSFGIWHEYTDKIDELAVRYSLSIARVHTHIGSGTDPEVWERAINLSLQNIARFPDATTLNLGGGFKVGRMKTEKTTDLAAVSAIVTQSLEHFEAETGRKLKLEIEPGTYLVANAGALVTSVRDIVDTGADGYTFLKIDAGMTEILRPSMYGAQHPIIVVNDLPKHTKSYVVVGHCCESGDLLTPLPGNPDALGPRNLQEARVGNLLVIESVGAYCASMNAQGYNSFPRSAEVMLGLDGTLTEMRARQSPEELWAAEYS